MSVARPPSPQSAPRLLERLLADGRITREQADAALSDYRRRREPIEEVLFDVLGLPETDYLKLLAAHYRTRFVSTDKLAKADIERATLDLVPRRLAEQHQVFPVLYDRASGTLSVVVADPDSLAALEEIRVVARVREVKGLVGRPMAIKAAIARTYAGDVRAFAALEAKTSGGLDASFGMYVDFDRRPAGAPSTVENPPRTAEMPMYRQLPADPPTPPPAPAPAIAPITSVPNIPVAAPVAPPPPLDPPARPTVAMPEPKPLVSSISGEAWLESLNVLVSLLENARTDLRGHSAHVARLTKRLCERLGLAARDADAIVAAAYLHDLGKASSYHLTALNVAEYDGHRHAAQKGFLTPSRLMAGVKLPEGTVGALNHMYERFDGKGFPDAQSGKDIPLGARVIAITDTYADLTQNPRNPLRKQLRPREASDVLAKYKGKIFDDSLVDLFRVVVTGDDLKAKLLADRHLALLVDPDPEETTVLELRMIEQGFDVKIVRSTDAALKLLGEQDFPLVVSEVELEPDDGFTLLSAVRSSRKRPPAWVFLASRADREDIQRGFDLGAVDYVQKPVRAEILVAKLRKIVEQASASQTATSPARGVSGSLEEMGLPELVQVLSQGRKTGALKIRSGADAGEIHFVAGDIFDAKFGRLAAEDAMYAMLKLQQGDFMLEPSFKAEKRVIQMSAEGLLLEGMRRMDEETR